MEGGEDVEDSNTEASYTAGDHMHQKPPNPNGFGMLKSIDNPIITYHLFI